MELDLVAIRGLPALDSRRELRRPTDELAP